MTLRRGSRSATDAREVAWWRAATVAATVAVCLLTLWPGAGGFGFPLWCIACGEDGVRDFVLNTALFVPVGLGLRRAGLSGPHAVLLGAAMSTGIESLQWLLPLGRFPILGDVIANTVGAALGVRLGRRSRLGAGARPATFGLAVFGWGAACALGAWGLGVAPLEGADLHGQWARHYPDTQPFGGSITSAFVNGFAVPDWEVASSAPVAPPFARGAYSLEVGVSEVPPSAGWAQLFALTDGRVPPNVELALVGCMLRLQTRVRASRLRLGTLMLVTPDACTERGEGLRVTGRLDRRAGLLRLQQGDRTLSQTSATLTPAALWRLLLPFAGLGRHEVPWTLLWTAGWGALLSLTIPRRDPRGIGARVLALAGAMLAIETVAALLWGVAWPRWADGAGITFGAYAADRLVRQLQASEPRPDRPRTPSSPQEGPA